MTFTGNLVQSSYKLFLLDSELYIFIRRIVGEWPAIRLPSWKWKKLLMNSVTEKILEKG